MVASTQKVNPWSRFTTWVICIIFNHHRWLLLEEYPQMVKAKIFTGNGFEEKEIENPFKKDKILGKWVCSRCSKVSIGTRHIP
jgi:hypothetical protein